MAEYIIRGESLTHIADEIRELSGTSDAMGLDAMATHVSEANVNVNTEASLIAQIASTLESKAVSGQATPIISVNHNGLITATAGTKSSTHQLAFQPAKTITPSTVSQIAVSSGYYTGGNVTVTGDSNLVAENIKSGVSIFGVSGTLESGGGRSWISDFIEGSPTIIEDDKTTEISVRCFASKSNLFSATFNAVNTIRNSAFYGCSNLTTTSFPVCTNIGSSAFAYCSTISKLYLGVSKVCTLSNSNAFNGTPYAGTTMYFSGTPYIYVPSSLVSSYKAGTNWAYYSKYIVPLGYVPPETFDFYIESLKCMAKPGMTWQEWIDTDYNEYDVFVDSNGKVCRWAYSYVMTSSGEYVFATDTIIKNETYTVFLDD